MVFKDTQLLAHLEVLTKLGFGGGKAGRVASGRANGPESLIEYILYLE